MREQNSGHACDATGCNAEDRPRPEVVHSLMTQDTGSLCSSSPFEAQHHVLTCRRGETLWDRQGAWSKPEAGVPCTLCQLAKWIDLRSSTLLHPLRCPCCRVNFMSEFSNCF